MPSGPRIRSQAYVRIRKLVQNGMTSRTMNSALRLPARVAMKYASGRPTSRHRSVPLRDSTRLVTTGPEFWSDGDVVVRGEATGVAARRRPHAEAEDEDDPERDHEQDDVPRGSRQHERGRQQGGQTRSRGARRPIPVGRRRGGHASSRSISGSAADVRDELFPDLDPEGIRRHVGRTFELGDDLVGREHPRIREDRRVDVLLRFVVRRRVVVDVRFLALDLRLMDEVQERVRGLGMRCAGQERPDVEPVQRPVARDDVLDVLGLRLGLELVETARPGDSQDRLARPERVLVVIGVEDEDVGRQALQQLAGRVQLGRIGRS